MRNLLLVCVAAFAVSCGSTKYLSSNVAPTEIDELLKLEAVSYISLIERGNDGAICDSVSQLSRIALRESLGTFGGRLCLPSEVITDSLDLEKLSLEIHYLMTTAGHNKNVGNISIPPFIETLLSDNGQRFGLILVQEGFTRSKGNYTKQALKGAGIGLATGVLFGVATTPTPVKASSTLHAIIVDNEEKNIAFFNSSTLQQEPMKKATIEKHLRKIFNKYLGNIE
jgi:hypothetical protein